ncbi:hypothetical protein SeMB42_g03008 [Synchytrium endobioticum]|uniref:Uncharacterized protein n=1 Tax=Synchytrium endobioticum TaxID=286115 RepID=A0A507DC41_9FUNG|nr:hypothetical protein SeMB42_g03008 [Synchytrium endobioticum]
MHSLIITSTCLAAHNNNTIKSHFRHSEMHWKLGFSHCRLISAFLWFLMFTISLMESHGVADGFDSTLKDKDETSHMLQKRASEPSTEHSIIPWDDTSVALFVSNKDESNGHVGHLRLRKRMERSAAIDIGNPPQEMDPSSSAIIRTIAASVHLQPSVDFSWCALLWLGFWLISATINFYLFTTFAQKAFYQDKSAGKMFAALSFFMLGTYSLVRVVSFSIDGTPAINEIPRVDYQDGTAGHGEARGTAASSSPDQLNNRLPGATSARAGYRRDGTPSFALSLRR